MPLRLSALASVFPVQGAVLLIVDDAIENTSQLALLLRAVGCSVHTANSAAEAQKVLAEVIPDVILLDIVMPEQDGLSFCEELKRDPRMEPVSVVFLSGLLDVKDKLRAFAVGGADFVTKPFDPTEVIARVSHQFRMIKMRKALLAEREQLLIANRQLQRSRQETVEVFEVLAEQLQGKTLDKKYRLEELIGTGGSAMVYRATQLQIQRAVAVKIMRPCGLGRDQKQNERFHAETTLAAKLQHPHIPVLIDAAVSSDGLRYIVMELLRGSPLSDVLRSSGPMAPDRCLEVMMPIVCAVAHAHRHGILHRDIKPSNIYLHHDERGEAPKLLDFGIAQTFEVEEEDEEPSTLPTASRRRLRRGDMVGTVGYMSPENMDELQCDSRADVYSIGVTLYEVLTGQLPYAVSREETVTELRRKMQDPPTPPSELRAAIPKALDDLVLRLLSPIPADRPATPELLLLLRELAIKLMEPKMFARFDSLCAA